MSFPGAVNIAVHQNRDKEINQLIILYFYGYTHILKPCFREISQKKLFFIEIGPQRLLCQIRAVFAERGL